MPLRLRLSLLVAIAVTVLLTMGGLFFISQLSSGLDTAMDTALLARADALAQQVGPDGRTGFQDAGADGLLPPNEALAQVVGSAGAVLDASEGAAGGPLLNAQQLAAARVGVVRLNRTTAAGGSLRLLAQPVQGAGSSPLVVVVGTTRALTIEALERVRVGLLVGGPLAVLVSAVGAYLLAGAALRPVERMRRQAEGITAGDAAARLSVPTTGDEVARLGATMNDLLHRLQHALAQQRDFVADAGHELRTPLAFLRSELELASRPGRSRSYLAGAVSRAADDTDRLIQLADDLLLLARPDEPDALLALAPVRLDLLAARAADACNTGAGAEPTAGVRVEAPEPLTVTADASRLRQVLDNLLSNAVRYAPADTTVTLRVACDDQARAVIEVGDRGPGFPPDFLPHAFERFRRADAARTPRSGGAGLGLAIVATLVRAHGGSVRADNRPGGGARVRVVLPPDISHSR